jgi:E3 ubiquitin-protein ligase HUWE1
VQHCKDFLNDKDGLKHLTRLLVMPCLPYDFANSPYSDSLVQVMRAMAEISPSETFEHLMKQIKLSTDETEQFWKKPDATSTLIEWVDISGTKTFSLQLTCISQSTLHMTDELALREANATFRKLITLHNRVTLLSDVCSSIAQTHAQCIYALLQVVSGAEVLGIIKNLGSIHRRCLLENIALKSGLSTKGIRDSSSRSASPEGGEMIASTISPVIPNGDVPGEIRIGVEANGANTSEGKKGESPQEQNAHALRHIASHIPNALVPFLQGISWLSMLVFVNSQMGLALVRTISYVIVRRSQETTSVQQATMLSQAIANVLHGHLTDDWTGMHSECLQLLSRVSNLRVDESLSSYTYYTVMLGLVTVLATEGTAWESVLL